MRHLPALGRIASNVSAGATLAALDGIHTIETALMLRSVKHLAAGVG